MEKVFKNFKALIYLKKNRKNQICNCGYGNAYSIADVVKVISKNKKINCKYSYSAKRKGDISFMFADSTKLKKILNWKQKNFKLEKMVFSEIKWKKKLIKK